MSPIPSTMRAVVAREPGGPEVLEIRSMPVPVPAEGELLIKVMAAGVNRPDLKQRQGNYAPPPGTTEILGLEISGIVVAVGEGGNDAFVGKEVCALVAGGGYAEYCVVPNEQALSKPSRLSFVEAGAVPETYFTVWTNLFSIGRLQKNETVLIHGGASGIGTTAIGLAKAFGARVLTTASTPHKIEKCLDLGADVAINYKREAFEKKVLEETGGKGVDVILDIVCADYLTRNLECLGDDGRLVVISFLGGGKGEINIEKMMRRRQTLCGSTLRPQSKAAKGRIAKDLHEHVWPLIDLGTVSPIIQSIYNLEEASAAHSELERGEHFGKIVLAVG